MPLSRRLNSLIGSVCRRIVGEGDRQMLRHPFFYEVDSALAHWRNQKASRTKETRDSAAAATNTPLPTSRLG